MTPASALSRTEIISHILSFVDKWDEETLRQFAHETLAADLQLAATSALERELFLLQQKYPTSDGDNA